MVPQPIPAPLGVTLEGIPEALDDGGHFTVHVSFDRSVGKIRIVFDYNKNIFYIIGGNYVGTGDTFECDSSGEEGDTSFEFQAGIKSLDRSCLEPFRILFLDSDGKAIAPAKQFLIRLRKRWRPELLSGIVGSLVNGVIFVWQARLFWTALVLAGIGMIAYQFYQYYAGLFSKETEEAVSLRLYRLPLGDRLVRLPFAFDGRWNTGSFQRSNKSPETAKKTDLGWEMTINQGETLKAVLPEHYSLFNFGAVFRFITFDKQKKAIWRIHAKDGEFYEFAYTFPENKTRGQLSAVFHKPGKDDDALILGNESDNASNLFSCIQKDDPVRVQMTVAGSKITVVMKLEQNPHPKGQCNDPGRNIENHFYWSDLSGRMPYGDFVFDGTSELVKVLIESDSFSGSGMNPK